MTKHMTEMPASHCDWIREIADAYVDAYQAIPYGAVFGDTITENELFHMAPEICLKIRRIKRTKANIKKATEAMLSSYAATQGHTPKILANPHIAFSFAYLTCHFAMDLLTEHYVDETMNYIEEHQVELGIEIEVRKAALANQAL